MSEKFYKKDNIMDDVSATITTQGDAGIALGIIDSHDAEHEPTYVQFKNGATAYAIWLEKYKRYVAIRKLTPKECFRLQGWTDDYFEKAQFVNSDSQLYKQAGNGVTVNVIETIGRRLTNDNHHQNEKPLLPDHAPAGRSERRVGEDSKGDDERNV